MPSSTPANHSQACSYPLNNKHHGGGGAGIIRLKAAIHTGYISGGVGARPQRSRKWNAPCSATIGTNHLTWQLPWHRNT